MPYSFVQSAPNSTSGGSTTTLTATLAANISANSKVIVAVAFQTDTNVGSVADGLGQAYRLIAAFTNATDAWQVQYFYLDYPSIAPGTNTVTLTVTTGVAKKAIWAFEYQGLQPGPVGAFSANRQVAPGTATNAMVSTNATPGILPATNSAWLEFAISMSYTGTAGSLPTQGTGFTSRAGSWSFGSGSTARAMDRRLTVGTATQATATSTVGTDTFYTFQIIFPELTPNIYIANPGGLAYVNNTNAAVYGVSTAMIITGRNNRYDPAFQAARALGCELLAYLDPMEGPQTGHTIGGLDDIFYQVIAGVATAPAWPFLTNGFGNPPNPPAGQTRQNFINTYMLDITVGSAWANHVVAYITALMQEGLVDGVFLDVIGARLFSTGATGANWGLYPSVGDWLAAEMDAWTLGCIDLVRRLDAARRAINPGFIILNNNIWTGDNDDYGVIGEQFVDGVCLEHHPYSSTSNVNYAGRAFGNLGHRRVLALCTQTATENGVTIPVSAEVAAWAQAKGVTNVFNQQSYVTLSSPLCAANLNSTVQQNASFVESGVGNTVIKSDGIGPPAMFGAAPSINPPIPSGALASSTAVSVATVTNQPSGTIYSVIDVSTNLIGITTTQIKAGNNKNNTAAAFSGNATITSIYAGLTITGLTANTTYMYAICQNNANGDSNIALGSFTTHT